MNILYISLDDPRKTATGSNQRNHFLWKALQKVGKVYTVYSIGNSATHVYDESECICTVSIKPTSWIERKYRYIFRGLIKYGNWPFRNVEKVRQTIGWTDVKFDVVVARCLGTASNLVAWKIAPLYVDIDDVPTLAFESILKQRLPFCIVPISRFLIRWWQKFVVKKCVGVWIVKEEDKKELPASTKSALLSNIANCPSDAYSVDQVESSKALVSIGNMGYEPNSSGVSWFLDNVWTEFHASHKDWCYIVVGGNVSEDSERKWSAVPGVKIMGFVADIEHVYEKSYAVIAPINSGAGTCIKVIESAMFGKKTFATPFAARGISERRMKDLGIDIFDNAHEFVNKFEVWEMLGIDERKKALALFRENAKIAYSFEGFCKSVKDMLENV